VGRSKSRGTHFTIAAIVLIAVAPAAAAAELSREQYVQRAEAICKSQFVTVTHEVKRGSKELHEDRQHSSGRRLLRASGLLERLGKQITAIPKPADDAKTLTEWLQQLDAQNRTLRKAGKALLAGKSPRAQGFVARFTHNVNVARGIVLGFGFNYCLFKVKL
jgi:hypothetical protein